MTVWVKEYNRLTLQSISTYARNQISVKKFISSDIINFSDILIVSNQDTDVSLTGFSLCTLVYYEEIYNKLCSSLVSEFLYNYDYYFLKNAILHATSPSTNINTLITGSSYGLFGIDATLLSNEENLSLASQDLYYSIKGIYKVWEKNHNIQNIVLCCNYYYFYSDQSKTQNSDELLRLSKVYKPLFNDIHNCLTLPPKQEFLCYSQIFDEQKILDIYSLQEYKKNYFHPQKTRVSMATREWADKSKNWNELSESEKNIASQKRAVIHNRLIKRNLSFIENKTLFNELSMFCTENNINLIITVTPVTKFYYHYLCPEYKNSFYQLLNDVKGLVHVIDLSTDSSFNNNDFNDMDHLNDQGATKMTSIILNFLQNLN